MKPKTKRNLKIAAALALIGGGIYYATRPKQQPAAVTPVLPPATGGAAGSGYVPPTTTTPVVVTPVVTTPPKVGDAVKTSRDTFGYTGAGSSQPYAAGGSNGYGQIEKGKYAGVIKAINTTFGTAQVQNFTYPMQYGSTNVYEYWIPLNWLTK